MTGQSSKPVLAFACLVALLVVLAAYFTERNGDIDELALYNPSYMLAHYGNLTDPAFGNFDVPVIVHPPVHVGLIGLFTRLGFTWYYAEATPTVILLLVAILAIVRSCFPAPVKLGLLFSIGLLMLPGEGLAVLFGTRPEGEVHAAWFAGLVLLESGRLDNWNRKRLFAGAFLLTWTSGLHYYAAPAFTGVVVYIIWAIRSLGWKNAKAPLLALCAGGCLFGVPYIAFYLLPYSSLVREAIGGSDAGEGIATAMREHLALYRALAANGALPALIREPLKLGIPLMVFSTALLAIFPSTRGIALAAAPMQLFIYFTSHKQSCYLIHEIALFATAICVASLMTLSWLLSRTRSPVLQRAFLTITATLLGVYLVSGKPLPRGAIVSTKARVHEADVARAAMRQILGPQARVVSRVGAWYSSGAQHWHSLRQDLLLDTGSYDVARYFANFDAAAEYPHSSDDTQNEEHTAISSWFADGTLKLRGFYFAETNVELQLLLFSSQHVTQVDGYAARDHQLYQFREVPSGDYSVIAAECPAEPVLTGGVSLVGSPSQFSTVLRLPKHTASAPGVLVTVLTPRHSPEPAGWIRQYCRPIAEVSGWLRIADRNALVDTLRREDQPIHFYRKVENVPGYTGVGVPPAATPPGNSVALGRVLDLSHIQIGDPSARIEHTPQLRILTGPHLGTYAAIIPVVQGGAVDVPNWVQIRLRVTAGRIGILAWNPKLGALKRTSFSVLKSVDPLDVVLSMPSLRDAAYIAIVNDSDDSPSQVELLDAAVLVSPETWERNRAMLSKLH
jgi:hypothetical protein